MPWNVGDPTVKKLQESTSIENITITGWGKITNNFSLTIKSYQEHAVAIRTLQKVELPMQSNQECKKTYADLDEDTMFCIGGVKGIT